MEANPLEELIERCTPKFQQFEKLSHDDQIDFHFFMRDLEAAQIFDLITPPPPPPQFTNHPRKITIHPA